MLIVRLFPIQRCLLLSCFIYQLPGFAGMEGEHHRFHRDD
jgi:hypothetical protein